MITEKIKIPEKCPYCGAPVVKQLEDGAHLYCSNKECHERKLQKLNYFVSKQCMNIDGLSEKTLRKLQSYGLVSNWWKLYTLKYKDLIDFGFGQKTSEKIISEVAKSRTAVPAENVLMALGIPMLGKVSATKLLQQFGSIKNICDAAYNNLASVSEIIGDVASKSLRDYIIDNQEDFKYVDMYLTTAYVNSTEANSNKLEGMTILATGTLNNFSREGIKDSILSNGGKYASGVNAKLTFMIVGENAGASKLNKAKELNIQIISESEYLELIK